MRIERSKRRRQQRELSGRVGSVGAAWRWVKQAVNEQVRTARLNPPAQVGGSNPAPSELAAPPPRRTDATPLAGSAAPQLDLQVAAVFVTSAIVVTLLEYLVKGGHGRLAYLLDCCGLASLAAGLRRLVEGPAYEFRHLAYFSLGCTAVYLLLPALVIKCVLRHRLRDYGLKFHGMFQDAWVYGVMLLVMAPVVTAVSFTEAFQSKYPFYRLTPGEPFWPHLIVWEVLYAIQFVALEFFFRGFMVHGTRRQLGVYSIFAMTIPYCMIHFGKPMLETFGAIGAGVVLGLMSLRTRSVWLGAGLHISVAWLMDTLALWHQGLLF